MRVWPRSAARADREVDGDALPGPRHRNRLAVDVRAAHLHALAGRWAGLGGQLIPSWITPAPSVPVTTVPKPRRRTPDQSAGGADRRRAAGAGWRTAARAPAQTIQPPSPLRTEQGMIGACARGEPASASRSSSSARVLSSDRHLGDLLW